MKPVKDSGYEIVKKEIFQGRWFVTLNKPLVNNRLKMPHANFVWLLHNPTFALIPKGYAVHHLDLDPLNDDPSNLALMNRFHHLAYHWKYKTINVPIEFSMVGIKNNFVFPNGRISEPKIYLDGGKGFRVQWFQDGENGKRVPKTIRGIDGKRFIKREEAEEAKKMLLRLSAKGWE